MGDLSSPDMYEPAWTRYVLLESLKIEGKALRDDLRAELTPDRLDRLERTLVAIAALSVEPASEERDANLRHVTATLADEKAIAACVLMRSVGRVSEVASRVIGDIARGFIFGALGSA